MKKISVFVVGFASIFSVNSFAQNLGDYYGEIAYAKLAVKDLSSYNFGEFNPTAARLTLGNVVMKNLAIEGFVVQGAENDSTIVDGVNVGLAAKSSWGFAVRPFINLNEKIELYGRYGSTQAKARVAGSLNGYSGSLDSKVTHAMYGAGLSYKISEKLRVIADYTKLTNKQEVKTSLVAVGLRYGFN